VVAESGIDCPPISMVSPWFFVPATNGATGVGAAPTGGASIYFARVTVFGSTVISLRRADTSAGIVS
jgi:hypothetical protein